MSRFDVFNPKRGLDTELGWNSNWDYRSPRTPGQNFTMQRPRFGSWSNRETASAGYKFDLTFSQRPIEFVRYVERFYLEHQKGYFTLIDHDNGEREHTGRFTAYSSDQETDNGKYTIGVTFEDLPGCLMRRYPNDWARSSHWIRVVDGFGYASPGADSTGTWKFQPNPASTSGLLDLSNASGIVAALTPGSLGQLYLAGALSVNFALLEYVGFGFRFSFHLATFLGICNVFLDGTEIITGLDLYNGTPGSVATGVKITGGGAAPLTVVMEQVPLGRHQLEVRGTGSKNASASDTAIIFPSVEVMH